MKTTSFLAAFLVLVGTSAFANGPGDPRMTVINQKETSLFKVIYEGDAIGRVRLTIFNRHNEIVFEDVKKSDGFIRKVNFAGMEFGEYTIQIADQNGKQTRTVVYGIKTSSVKDVTVSKMPEDGKYLLAVTNNSPEQIHLNIFDGSNNLVHSEDMTIDGKLKLVYNLKNVEGIPTFQVTDQTGNVHTIVKN